MAKTYRDLNPNAAPYIFTRNGAKHWRMEGEAFVMYSTPGGGGRDVIYLTEEDKQKVAHHQPVLHIGAPVIMNSVNDGDDKKIKTSVTTDKPVDIPADWESLSARDRKAIAEEISGDSVRTGAEADDIITGYLAAKKGNV